jgi:hypothetical protein
MTSRTRTFQTRRGFGTVAVILTLTLVGATLLVTSSLFAHEIRRTRSAVAETQLRQLLVAGIPAARAQVGNTGPARDLPLDTPVDGAQVTLHLEPQNGGGLVATVTARYRGQIASQRLAFTPSGDLATATLEKTGGM